MTTHTHTRRDALMSQFRQAKTFEQRRRLAGLLVEADRSDAADESDGCDCDASGCTRLDGIEALSLRKAARWIGATRVRELEALDPTSRLTLVETLEAAARHAGETAPEMFAGIRGADQDTLRAAYEQLPDPDDEPEQEKTDMSDLEQEARARMNRNAYLAGRLPLDGTKPSNEELERIGAEARRYDALEADRRDYQRGRLSTDEARLDTDEAVADVKTGAPVAELEQLIAISKRESIPLQELLDALERVKQLRASDDPTRTDALDEDSAAKARMNARYHAASSRPFDTKGNIIEDEVA